MLFRIAYIADHLGLISLSPIMFYSTFMQAIRYIVCTEEIAIVNMIKGTATPSAQADITASITYNVIACQSSTHLHEDFAST
jgi:hypothetical protein